MAWLPTIFSIKLSWYHLYLELKLFQSMPSAKRDQKYTFQHKFSTKDINTQSLFCLTTCSAHRWKYVFYQAFTCKKLRVTNSTSANTPVTLPTVRNTMHTSDQCLKKKIVHTHAHTHVLSQARTFSSAVRMRKFIRPLACPLRRMHQCSFTCAFGHMVTRSHVRSVVHTFNLGRVWACWGVNLWGYFQNIQNQN